LQYDLRPETGDLAEIIVGKQRNGPTGSVMLTFIRRSGRFATTELYRRPPADRARAT
ncbi:MAG: DnaB-like helicase C-terminal domain-containing protein, partial [Firmicutes bacterium]|nr:DnaB-like helicase C-terminal domain-containing protein [Bacillota bacterium]